MITYYLLYLSFPFALGPEDVIDGEDIDTEAYGNEDVIDEEAESKSKES